MDRSDTLQCIDWRSVDKTCSRFRALYYFSLPWMTFTFGYIPMQIVVLLVHAMLRGKSQKRTVWVQIDKVLCDPTVLRGKCWQLGQQTFCPQGEIVSALVLILHLIINAVLVVSFTILDHHQHRRHHHKYHRAISTFTKSNFWLHEQSENIKKNLHLQLCIINPKTYTSLIWWQTLIWFPTSFHSAWFSDLRGVVSKILRGLGLVSLSDYALSLWSSAS